MARTPRSMEADSMGKMPRSWLIVGLLALVLLGGAAMVWRHLGARGWAALDPESPEGMEKQLYSALRKYGTIDYPDLGYSLSVETVRGRTLCNPIIRRVSAQGKEEMVIRSRVADLHVHP